MRLVVILCLVGCRGEPTKFTVETGGVETGVEETGTETDVETGAETGVDTGDFVDADGDGYGAQEDCDDSDPTFHPGATEADCTDPNDYNCDGSVGYADADADGFAACEDCDDLLAEVNDDADEVCDGLDNDCNGFVDSDDPNLADGISWYADVDGDGYGADHFVIEACEQPDGYTAAADDCDDLDASSHPGALEVCDSVDNDCNGAIDEGVGLTWYADADGDGYGDASSTQESCTQPAGYSANGDDCDDGDPSARPGGVEVCDGADNDCDGAIDGSGALDASNWYADADGDGYGDDATVVEDCSAPSGHVASSGDCNDGDAAVSPAAVESCDNIDNDCDGTIDGANSVDASTWYADGDGDGDGDSNNAIVACEAPSGAVATGGDCDDADAALNHLDADSDGASSCDGDCDDSDAGLNLSDADADGENTCDGDCDDANGAVYTSAQEICDNLDNDCDGSTESYGPTQIQGGSLASGVSQHYQYSPTTPGAGQVNANWSAEPGVDGYELAVGTTSGATDVITWSSVGSVTSASVAGLSLDGAWTGAEYFVSIRSVVAGSSCAGVATSDAVQVAEGVTFTGSISELRTDDAYGGATQDWPQSGVDAVWGTHVFEQVQISASSTVYVQGWGRVDSVSSGVASTDAVVTGPADGWVSLLANHIVVDGTILASGRGYGGGAGGGGGPQGPAGYRGLGGNNGLGGDGGSPNNGGAGAGGGGSPGGIGGTSGNNGGSGSLLGGGSGGTGCSGNNGRGGGDGPTGTVGGTGGTASSGSPGAGGAGEFDPGGGNGVVGCDNWTGGGGGGYGGGGSGGTQWSAVDSAGGGGGGTGGVGGGQSNNGGVGAGPFGGSGGAANSSAGVAGGYLASSANGDASTDRSVALGGGGGGGGSGAQEAGGGGGAAGGGAISLYAVDTLNIGTTASLRSNGAGGGGGGRDNGGNATSYVGGPGAGGTLVLEGNTLIVDAVNEYVSVRGGDGQTSNGGTIKLFYGTFSGTLPSNTYAGRVYDAGNGSYQAP
jgi:hypothetical protein